MERQPRIAIVGAGLGGLMTAILLQRFGYDIEVFEQATKLQRVGSGMNMSPHITRLFRDIGLLDRLLEVGFVPRRRYSRNGYTGEIMFTTAIDDFAEKYEMPSMFIHRGDLQEALVSAVEPGTISLDKRLVNVAEMTDAIRLFFADDTTAEADIVIGADGIDSRIRELILSPEPPVFSGEVAYRSIFPVDLLGDMAIGDQTKWWGDDRYILIYFLTRARDQLYFVTGVPEADWGDENYAPRPADTQKLRNAFARFHSDVTRVIEAAPYVTAWPILERDPLPLWSRGRIVLLGDACHPMRPHMGQGAAMAFEDGAMLARCIDHYKGQDTRAIFQLYETQRRDRASRVQLNTQRNDWMRHGMGDAAGDPGWLYGYNVLTVPLDGDSTGQEAFHS